MNLEDIDECITGNHDCDVNANCTNTVGGHNCTCKEGFTGDGRSCSAENWKKINDAFVCFGARDDSNGIFAIKESGLIHTFKLVHRSGSFICNSNFPASYWGCEKSSYEDQRLLSVITYPNKTALLIANYTKNENNCKSRYYSYSIAGIGVNSAELVFNKLATPLSVSVGQEFQIWYGEDLINCSESDNSGQTCADVYASYVPV
ncbi:hypothetical protein ACROYT_G011388 [Oculina patagonica]